MSAIARRILPALLPGLALVLACSGDGGPGPGGGGGAPDRLAIVPGALLLPAPGETAALRVVGITANGDTTEVDDAVAWTSSHPGIVGVSAAGVATAHALGAAVVTAQAGGLTSSPILALVAQPTAGALLVSDDQVIGGITPVDPAAAYVPGWQYRVRLRGVSPALNQVVLASGGAPVGGRVVSVSPAAGGDVDVVLALLSLSGMFADLSVDVQVPLANALVLVPAGSRARIGGAANLAPRAPGVAERRIEQEFSIGRFDCKAEIPPAFVFPVTLDAVEVGVDPQLTFDVVIKGSTVKRLVAHGSVGARLSANPLITAALEAKAECLFTARVIILPIGGPVSLIIGGQIPVGVGFEVGAKATFGQLGFDAFYQASLAAAFGIDCTGACKVVAEMTTSPPEGFFKPKIPSFADDLRFDLTGSAFGFAKLTIGNPMIRELRFETVELKAGIEQKFELAGLTAQANDQAYASTFALKPVVEFKTSSKLDAVAGLLGITLAELAFAPDLPVISQSPRGTFTITPASVVAGDGTQLGDQATFSVNLADVSYLGVYAVDGVAIRWRKTNGTTVVLEPGRPGCTDLAAAQGQATFTCQTDFLAADEGSQTFHAFVKAKIFGIALPAPLEIAPDARAAVNVTTGQSAGTVAVTLDRFQLAACAINQQSSCSNDIVTAPADAPSFSGAASRTETVQFITGSITNAASAGGSFQATAGGGAGITGSSSGSTLNGGSSSISREWTIVVSGGPVQFAFTGTCSISLSGPAGRTSGQVDWKLSPISLNTGGFVAEKACNFRENDTNATQPNGSIQQSGTLVPGRWVLQLNAVSGGLKNDNTPDTWTSAVSDEFSLTFSP